MVMDVPHFVSCEAERTRGFLSEDVLGSETTGANISTFAVRKGANFLSRMAVVDVTSAAVRVKWVVAVAEGVPYDCTTIRKSAAEFDFLKRADSVVKANVDATVVVCTEDRHDALSLRHSVIR